MAIPMERTWSGERARDRGLAWAVAGALGAWFLIVLAAGAAGVFHAGPSEPPAAILAAIAGPPLLFGMAYRLSPRIRAFALGLDLQLITAMQGWRVIGGMFLVLHAFGLVPGLFAWPAGLGDVAVGLAAPFVARAVATRRPGWQRRVFWLNVGGLVDFAGAVGTGVLSSDTALGVLATGAPAVSLGLLPLSLIPTFGVPLWIILHAVSLLQVRRV